MRLILIIHNVRSAHNVGALLRTADGAGVDEIILTGYTPSPAKLGARYLTDAQKSLAKTALGAEKMAIWKRSTSIGKTITDLKTSGFEVVALEQSSGSRDYRKYRPKTNVALLVGNEPLGLDTRVLKHCDTIIELPMRGSKNSLNVAVAAGIALYTIRDTMGEKVK